MPKRKLRRIRLHEFMDRYVEDYLKIKDARSWKREMGRIRRILEYFGNPYVDKIYTDDLEHFLAGLQRSGLKPATINRYIARLSSLMKRAMAWGYRQDNPVVSIENLRESKMGDRYLEDSEYQTLLETCGPVLRALVVLAANTGIRRGELMTLRWEDVDFDNAQLVIRAVNSKTAESRVVPLNLDVIDSLRSLDPKPVGQVVPFKNFPRQQWDEVRANLGWDRIETPRLKGWRWHDFRHDAASRMAMADVPLSKIGKILGHKSLVTTQRYAHMSDKSLHDAVDRIRR
ncbi:tyrosine-type recombinase/integrase [Gemmatimonadota bacterium]